MNTAIELTMEETLTQDHQVTAHDMERLSVIPAGRNQHKVEWVRIRLTNPQRLN